MDCVCVLTTAYFQRLPTHLIEPCFAREMKFMYTEEDLSSAVKAGIFSDDAVSQFRTFIAKEQSSFSVDEEHFRLVTGFNDIYVVIACCLLLISAAWLGHEVSNAIGALTVALASWGLSEFFVLKRKMALPAIVLLATFIGGVAWFAGALFHTIGSDLGVSTMLASGVAGSVAARFHWLRFKVPITVAAGVASIVGASIAVAMIKFPEAQQWSRTLFLTGGLFSFALAMRWDAEDTKRQTGKSDVAFWLHLLAAPLIVHPIFSMLGVFEGNNGLLLPVAVIFLYVMLAVISIAIDRRALMVSALIYVLFTFSSLLKTYGIVSLGFAITGLIIGSALLLLSAYWHVSRVYLIKFLPKSALVWIPPLK